MSAAEVIEAELKERTRFGTDRRIDVADAIATALENAGHLYEDGRVSTVEVHGARVVTECVEAYGLVIELDANGNAVTVESPWGFAVTA